MEATYFRDLVSLSVRIFSDKLPSNADAIYLFWETSDNQASVLNKGADLHLSGLSKLICISGLGEAAGYPGVDCWRKELFKRLVSSQAIIEISPHQTSNTLTEAVQLVETAKQRDWEKIVVVAPAFHALRAFIGAVSVTLRDYPDLKIYNQVGTYLNWHQIVVHSQGILKADRTELINAELDRIAKYHQKGDLVTPRAAIEYLNRRDF